MYLHSSGKPRDVTESIIGKLTSVPIQDVSTRRDYIVYLQPHNLTAFSGDFIGYGGLFGPNEVETSCPTYLPRILGCRNLDYLTDGDVLLLLPSGTTNVLYRKSSAHNSILVTERCNSLCLMCSQPPKAADDSYRVKEVLRLIELINPECKEIGITGGEPTLLREDFLMIVRKFAASLPNTALHVLTNGRLFKDRKFAQSLGAIKHRDLMLGIPLYSDVDYQHDYVVQARGAFNETVFGLYNLAESEVSVEIRVVIHKQTYQRLPQLAEFIYRNFPFAAHVALMGMEMFGYVNLNLDTLWIDPADYQSELEEATLSLALNGMNVSIYNHQLCILPQSIWPFARRSISDWKNVYLPACDSCEARRICGGFFQSATKRHSQHIKPFEKIDEGTVAVLAERA